MDVPGRYIEAEEFYHLVRRAFDFRESAALQATAQAKYAILTSVQLLERFFPRLYCLLTREKHESNPCFACPFSHGDYLPISSKGHFVGTNSMSTSYRQITACSRCPSISEGSRFVQVPFIVKCCSSISVT